MSEKRIRERFEFGTHGYCYYCSVPDVRVPFAFQIDDISYKGMGIVTNQPLVMDSILFLRFGMKDQVREFKVRVKWCKKDSFHYQAGVEFLNVVRGDIMFLHQIIKKL